jgi:two-component system cell cycle response regulator DivK
VSDRKLVLLIEDTASHQRLYTLWLKIGGYRTALASDERIAVAEAARLQPDLIIVDIRLPYVSGLDIIEALKGGVTTRHIPILALTVLDRHEAEAACLAAGADAFALKPIEMDSFLQNVGQFWRVETSR